MKTVLGDAAAELRDRTGGARKELAVYALAYNLVRAVIVRAAARQGTTPDRVGFTDALRWLLAAAPGATAPELLIHPHRPGRYEPRVVRDYVDTFPIMRHPRRTLRAKLRAVTR